MFPKIALLLAAAVILGAAGCSKKKGTDQQAKINAFRQKQKIEAIKAYTAIVEKYPDSEFAAQAKERLAVLGPLPAATPAPKKK